MLESGRLVAPFNQTTPASESFFLATPSNKPVRARLVAREVNKTGKEDALYASTPPGKSKKV